MPQWFGKGFHFSAINAIASFDNPKNLLNFYYPVFN